jgi:hypothetical protein
MRVIVHSKSQGTLLAYEAFLGWVLFSQASGDVVDEVRARQTALTFADAGEAQAFIKRIGGVLEADAPEPKQLFPSDLTFLVVESDAEYAPMSACVAAGVPPWGVAAS